MRNKIFLTIILSIFLIGLVSSINCKDVFYNIESTYQICGYCHEENGSTCLASRQCNFSIYYENGTNLLYQINTTNNNDGSFTYNLSNATSLGNYFGFMICDERSYSEFSFQILSPPTPYIGSGGGYPLYYEPPKDELPGKCYYISSAFDCIPKYNEYECKKTYFDTKEECLTELNKLKKQPALLRDLRMNVYYIGGEIYPSHPTLGFFGIISIIVLIGLLIKYLRKKKLVKRKNI